MKTRKVEELQLSLFDPAPQTVEPPAKSFDSPPPTVMEFLRARVEKGPEMTQEEYKRWVKVLIHHALKRMD